MFYIRIEDLAAVSLIQALQDKRRFLPYDVIESYGNRVVQRLNSDPKKKAVLILSRESTSELFRNYSDFFTESTHDGKIGIELKEGKRVQDLIDKFCGYLALDVLKALLNEKIDLQVA